MRINVSDGFLVGINGEKFMVNYTADYMFYLGCWLVVVGC